MSSRHFRRSRSSTSAALSALSDSSTSDCACGMLVSGSALGPLRRDASFAPRRGPDRAGVMAIVLETRHDVPMHVGDHIAKARQVHLVRLHRLAHHGLDREYHRHEATAFVLPEVGHLRRMALEDHPAKTRIVRLVRPHHSAKIILPEHGPARGRAELARYRRRIHATLTPMVVETRAGGQPFQPNGLKWLTSARRGAKPPAGQSRTRSMPPRLARATNSFIQSSPSRLLAISTTM